MTREPNTDLRGLDAIRVLTVAQVAALMGESVEKIRDRIRMGQIRGCVRGGRYVTTMAWVQEYLEGLEKHKDNDVNAFRIRGGKRLYGHEKVA